MAYDSEMVNSNSIDCPSKVFLAEFFLNVLQRGAGVISRTKKKRHFGNFREETKLAGCTDLKLVVPRVVPVAFGTQVSVHSYVESDILLVLY